MSPIPQIREKKPRALNANVKLNLTLSPQEAEKLAQAYPNNKRSEAMNMLVQKLLDAWFGAGETKQAKK